MFQSERGCTAITVALFVCGFAAITVALVVSCFPVPRDEHEQEQDSAKTWPMREAPFSRQMRGDVVRNLVGMRFVKIELLSEHENSSGRPLPLESFYLQTTMLTAQQFANIEFLKSEMDLQHFAFVSEPNLIHTGLSWNDATEMANFLSEIDPRYDYRLPTVAEWEYTVSERSTIKVVTLPSAANRERVNGISRRHLAAGGPPNRLGIYDLLGGDGEYCSDDCGSLPEIRAKQRGYNRNRTFGKAVKGQVHDPKKYSFTDTHCESARGSEGSMLLGVRFVAVPKKTEPTKSEH